MDLVRAYCTKASWCFIRRRIVYNRYLCKRVMKASEKPIFELPVQWLNNIDHLWLRIRVHLLQQLWIQRPVD